MPAREYELALDVDHAGEAFRGALTIWLDGATGSLDLDCAELTIESVTVAGRSVEVLHDARQQTLRVPLGDSAPDRVDISYRGRVRRNVLNGFYVSSFGPGHLLTTMMQPVGCRWLLPCVDRPDAKAVFRLRVTTDPRLTVVTNAPAERSVEVDGRRVWQFAPTPRMSTYLLYLGVGEFDSIEATHEGVRIIAATPPGKAALAQRSLGMAGPLLQEYAAYYGVPYPLPKLHLVAVPDLWAGGMENWGAIVFPEIGLLWDDSTSPAIVRWAVETLSHEIAHQWFGDLVTTRTWDDLWLNESFATFVASKMEERLGLRADAWAEFFIRTAPGYFSDSYTSTHPVRLTIRDPAEISQSTDDITYFKGANVVRMIETFLGEATFRSGVSAYLKRFAYGNASEDDLWTALEEASGQPVRKVMRAWVDRAGFPMLRVSRSNGRLSVQQERFTFLKSSSKPELPWPIPLRIRTGSETRRVLVESATEEIPVGTAEPVIVNPGRTSFLRVWYDPAERERRIANLASYAPADRWAFLNDAFAFVLSDDYPLRDYLAAVGAVSTVTDYPSVDDVTGSLRFLVRTVADLSPVEDVARAFLRAQWSRLGDAKRPGETDTDAVARQSVARGLVRLDPEFGRTLARPYPDTGSLDAALRPAAALAFAMYGGPGVVDTLFDQMRTATRQDDAEQAALAAEGLSTESQVRDALSRCLGEGVRTSLAQYLVRSVAASLAGRDALWEWLPKNLREFERRGEGSWMLSVLLEGVLPMVGVGREEEVRSYFDREKFPEGSNGIRRGLELLEVVGRLRERLRGTRS